MLLVLHLADYFYVLNADALQNVYFAYFHSVIKCGIIFCGNCTNIGWVFLFQKKIIRTIVGVVSQCVCSGLFRKLEILPVPCLY